MAQEIVTVDFNDQTTALTETDMSKILVFTNSVDVDYQETTDTATITELGTDTTGYELLELILAQDTQEVAVFGVEGIGSDDIKTQLNTIISEDFFFIVSDITDSDGLQAIAEWATSNDRIAILTTTVGSTTDEIETIINNINSGNVAIYPHVGSPSGTGQVFVNAGITGLMAQKTVGSATWALKSPVSIPKVYYSLTEENALISAYANIYTEIMGVGATRGGRTTDGSYIDITQSKYWLENKLKTNLTSLLLNNDKIPFTDEGSAKILNVIESVITVADSQGILLEDDTTITIPRASEVLTNDKANRIWSNITIDTTIQGAVETLDVTFTLSL